MREWILSNELAVRLGVFVGIFGLMAVWEVLGARRRLTAGKGRHWFGNPGLVFSVTSR